MLQMHPRLWECVFLILRQTNCIHHGAKQILATPIFICCRMTVASCKVFDTKYIFHRSSSRHSLTAILLTSEFSGKVILRHFFLLRRFLRFFALPSSGVPSSSESSSSTSEIAFFAVEYVLHNNIDSPHSNG